MTSSEIRQTFFKFMQERGHTLVPPSSLVPGDDPSVLFTIAGMQQFKDYYTQPELSSSPRIVTVQPVVRTIDIEEVGDNRHLTLFEMLGFFSFGFKPGSTQDEKSPTPYFKEVAIKQAYDFYFKELQIPMERSYVTVYEGKPGVPRDEESAEIWKQLGVPEDQIRYMGDDNFWANLGPNNPCGPTTEIYVDDIEVGNVVFNQYFMNQDGSLSPLEYQGVDTGLGLERIAIVVQGKKEVFETDLFAPIIEKLVELSDPSRYNDKSGRIIADHLKASMFLIADGVRPSNKTQGYILRRLIRRMVVNVNAIRLPQDRIVDIVEAIYKAYSTDYDRLATEYGMIHSVLGEELSRFSKTLEVGLKEFEKIKAACQERHVLPPDEAFKLFDTYGFPVELTQELAEKDGYSLDMKDFGERFKAHQETSRAGLDKVFKGGLADHEPQTIKHHTAHHLLLAALRKVLGEHVFQRGSNVTAERLRIDFSHPGKVTAEQLLEVQEIVNQAIFEDLEIRREEMPRAEAEKLGALAEFGAKYGDTVTVYTIFNKDGSVFSREFCGGPHVGRTSELGVFSVLKEEASSAGIRRIKAKAV